MTPDLQHTLNMFVVKAVLIPVAIMLPFYFLYAWFAVHAPASRRRRRH